MIEFNEKLRQEVLPRLFNKDASKQRGSLPFDAKASILNEEALSFICKYNLLMSHSSLQDACDKSSEFVLQMASFGIQHFTAALSDHQKESRSLEKLSRKALTTLFEVPYILVD